MPGTLTRSSASNLQVPALGIAKVITVSAGDVELPPVAVVVTGLVLATTVAATVPVENAVCVGMKEVDAVGVGVGLGVAVPVPVCVGVQEEVSVPDCVGVGEPLREMEPD